MQTLAVWPSAGSTSGGKNGKCKDWRLALVQPLRTDRVSECRSGEERQGGDGSVQSQKAFYENGSTFTGF